MGPVENLKFAMQRGRRGDSHRCGHLGMIRVDTALTADCVPCVRSGDTWVHLVRGGSLADSMSDCLIRTLRQTPNIDIRYHAEVVGASGERRLQRLKIRDTSTAAPDHLPAVAVFIMVGAEPSTDWMPAEIRRDRWGHVMTSVDAGSRAARGLFWTAAPGVYAVGDVRHGAAKRVASSAGEGSVVIGSVHRNLAQLSDTGNYP